MNIFRAENPQAILLIRDHLIDDPGVETYTVAGELMAFMKTSPEKVLLVIITDEVENKVDIKGFLLAWIPDGRNYLMIHQAHWIDKNFNQEHPKMSKKIISMAEAFAELNGLDSLRIETQRSPEAFFRDYGFETLSAVLEYKIT